MKDLEILEFWKMSLKFLNILENYHPHKSYIKRQPANSPKSSHPFKITFNHGEKHYIMQNIHRAELGSYFLEY